MTHTQRITRINAICSKYELDFEVLVNKQKKILLGGSFDSIYYYQFFLWFTGVEMDESSRDLEPELAKYRFLSLEDKATNPLTGLHQTAVHYSPSQVILLNQKGLYYYAPADPLYTLLGIGPEGESDSTRTLMDITQVVDQCYALEDAFPA